MILTSQTVTKEDFDFAVKPIQLRQQQQQQQQEEIVIVHTASVFVDTAFERMLANAGIITVVFAGIATEFGIEFAPRCSEQRVLFCSNFRLRIFSGEKCT